MAVEALKARRSFRNFDASYEITKDQMDAIIESALNSPSALNLQEQDIVVVRNKELIDKIDNVIMQKCPEDARKRFEDRRNKFGNRNYATYDCSALICVVNNERSGPLGDIDAGILSMGIMVAAQGVGLGSVPLGSVCQPEVEELLGVPKGSLRLGIAVGKPKDTHFDPKQTLRKVRYID